MAVDELIERITPLRGRPLWTHLYLSPFFAAYAGWLVAWLGWIGAEHWELGCIVMAALGLSQVLALLSCHWSVGVRAFIGLDTSADPFGGGAEAVEVDVTADRVDVTGGRDALGRDHLGAGTVLGFGAEDEAGIVRIVGVPIVVVVVDPHG